MKKDLKKVSIKLNENISKARSTESMLKLNKILKEKMNELNLKNRENSKMNSLSKDHSPQNIKNDQRVHNQSISRNEITSQRLDKKLFEDNPVNNSTIDIKPFKTTERNIISLSKLDKLGMLNRSKSPANYNNNNHSHHTSNNCTLEEEKLKNTLNSLKLCQLKHLPSEKSYLITEKNLKLIETGILEKDHDIEHLKGILNIARNDILNAQEKQTVLNQLNSELIKQHDKYKYNLESINEENSKIKASFDRYVSEFNKVMVVYKKIKNILKIVFDSVELYSDYLSVHSNPDEEEVCEKKQEKTQLFTEKNIKMQKNIEILLKAVEDNDIRNFEFLLRKSMNNKEKSMIIDSSTQNQQSMASPNQSSFREDTFFFNESTSTKKNYIQEIEEKYLAIDKDNLLLKAQLYDYENFLNKFTSIYEEKNFNLTEAAKDVINMKKRIVELNKINVMLEKENSLLKITIHNLQNEVTNSQYDAENRVVDGVKEMKTRLKEHEDSRSILNQEIIKVKTILENNEKYYKLKEENDKKCYDDLFAKYNAIISGNSNLVETTAFKDNENKKLLLEKQLLLAENTRLKEQYERLFSNYQALNTEFEKFKIKQMRDEENENYIENAKNLENDNFLLQAKINGLQEDLNKKDSVITELRTQVLEYEKEKAIYRGGDSSSSEMMFFPTFGKKKKSSIANYVNFSGNDKGEVDNLNFSADVNLISIEEDNTKKLKKIIVKKDMEIQNLKEKVKEVMKMKNLASRPIETYVDEKYSFIYYDLLNHLNNQAKLLENLVDYK